LPNLFFHIYKYYNYKDITTIIFIFSSAKSIKARRLQGCRGPIFRTLFAGVEYLGKIFHSAEI
jgi:hypothetical protein